MSARRSRSSDRPGLMLETLRNPERDNKRASYSGSSRQAGRPRAGWPFVALGSPRSTTVSSTSGSAWRAASSDAAGIPVARLRDVSATRTLPAAHTGSLDIGSLARQVFSLLKAELRNERERNGLFSR